jgi:ribosomal 50S subunit-associated protein YjgA (DUF615 family)
MRRHNGIQTDHMTKEEKTGRLAFRMSPTDAAMLAALSEHEGESLATVLRTLIRRAYTEQFGDKKPTKKRH